MKLAAPRMPVREEATPVVRVDDVYLSLTETLPAYSGLSERTLRAYLKHPAHALPCYRIGGRILVRRSEYDAWALRFRAAPASAVDALVAGALRGL